MCILLFWSYQSMACQFNELCLGLNQEFPNLIQHRFLSLLRAHHWFPCLLLIELRLFSNKIFDCTVWLYYSEETAMVLFCFFFNSIICSWKKLLSWKSWWILQSSLNFSTVSLLYAAWSPSYLLFILLNFLPSFTLPPPATPFYLGEGRRWISYQFFKRGGLSGNQFLERCCFFKEGGGRVQLRI